MQRVHHWEVGDDARLPSHFPDFQLVRVPQIGDGPVGKAHLLGFLQRGQITGLPRQHFFHVGDLFQRFQEQRGDHRDLGQLVYPRAPADQLGDGEDAVGAELIDIAPQAVVVHAVEAGQAQVMRAVLQRAH